MSGSCGVPVGGCVDHMPLSNLYAADVKDWCRCYWNAISFHVKTVFQLKSKCRRCVATEKERGIEIELKHLHTLSQCSFAIGITQDIIDRCLFQDKTLDPIEIAVHDRLSSMGVAGNMTNNCDRGVIAHGAMTYHMHYEQPIKDWYEQFVDAWHGVGVTPDPINFTIENLVWIRVYDKSKYVDTEAGNYLCPT